MKIYSIILLSYFILDFLIRFIKTKEKKNIFYIMLLMPILMEVIK